MTRRDHVTGWAVAGLIVLLSVYCALMGERFSYSVQDWWNSQHSSQGEGE